MTPYEALVAERYGENQWWTRKRPEPKPEDELTCRRRLAECIKEADQMDRPAKESA